MSKTVNVYVGNKENGKPLTKSLRNKVSPGDQIFWLIKLLAKETFKNLISQILPT
jgi:hypothetical protein